MSPLEYLPLADPQIADRYGDILRQCFNISTWEEDPFYNRLGIHNYRTLQQGTTTLGGLAMIPMGQWFGGRRVSMTGIAGVAIAPEHRGMGAARFLMEQALQELYQDGVAISTLYPAVHRLYRQVGYGFGGTHYGWSLKTESIRAAERHLAIHPILPVDGSFPVEQLLPLYQQQAPYHNGHLDRHPRIWHDRTSLGKQDLLYAYHLGEPDHLEGYVIFKQFRDGNSTVIQIRDAVLLTPEALQTFWKFLADQQSQTDRVQWQGAANDLLAPVLPEPTAHIDHADRWLLRLVNVPLALEQRGYPPHIRAELHIALQDPVLPANTGHFTLSVAEGRATVRKSGNGDMSIHPCGLASLYTSLFSPQQLRLLGLLEGSDTALATASAIFSGTSPWLPDFF